LRTELESRLKQLQAEYNAGMRELEELQNKETNLKQTLTRIMGAIQVIEQELKSANP
jgi:predicted nuclease with TOPRIM domain